MLQRSLYCNVFRDVPGVEETEVTAIPVLLIDTSGCDLQELTLCGEVSKGNEGEADIVTSHVEHLINSGLPAKDIAVIAPYNLQVISHFQAVLNKESVLHPEIFQILSVSASQAKQNTHRKKTQDNIRLNSLCNDICIVIHIYI